MPYRSSTIVFLGSSLAKMSFAEVFDPTSEAFFFFFLQYIVLYSSSDPFVDIVAIRAGQQYLRYSGKPALLTVLLYWPDA